MSKQMTLVFKTRAALSCITPVSTDIVYGRHCSYISDDIFLPKEVEFARMDDFEREIEEFKRSAVFCVLLVTVVCY